MMALKKIFVFAACAFWLVGRPAFAYFEEYPPYFFKQGAPKQFQAKLLLEDGQTEFLSGDGKLVIRLKHAEDAYSFLLQDGDTVLAKVDEAADFFVEQVYQADLDKNGFLDLIVFSSSRGAGLGAHFGVVDIYLKSSLIRYEHIHYESFGAGPEDFVDLDGDGRAEVIVGSFYQGEKHNYYAYSVYGIENGKLVNADAKHAGFPKFVQYTNRRNDQNDSRLTPQEKAGHIRKVESRFQ